jgi:hypothetical protein
MKLGAGLDSTAPFPYIASTALPKSISFNYSGVVCPAHLDLCQPSAISGPAEIGKSLERNAGRLPIWRVAAASSAFAGDMAVDGFSKNQMLASLNDADLTPWVTTTDEGGAEFLAAELVVEDMRKVAGVTMGIIDGLASLGVHGVIDGGLSGGTALGIAVAAGAEEVLLIMNSASGDGCNPFYLEILMRDGPRPLNQNQPAVLYPLFETTASTLSKAWSTFDELKLPSGTQFLKRFIAGTMQLTTANSDYFGFARGRNITLHLVQICANLNIGFLERYVNYGALTQEIIAAVVDKDNGPFVKKALLPMFIGHAVSGQAVDIV